MDLFRESESRRIAAAAPLAVRMRPRTLDEFAGQQQFLGPGKLLRRMLEADRLTSVILYGPPGTGKTTLAQIIAGHTSAEFVEFNAAGSGVKEVRAALDEARDRLAVRGKRTVLFIDEIHRFSRAQQDVLLSDVEKGVVIFVGATTENPFFAVNSPLVSRSTIFQFEKLSEADIVGVLRRALDDAERGLGRYTVRADDEALAHLATVCDGDARRALGALEVGVLSQQNSAGAEIVFDLAVAQESIQKKAVVYDRTGDDHYDAASAFIKSMRGSDPDAAIYWMARMLAAGEDPRFIARRIVICAAEDVGNADPQAIVVAAAALQISEFIGLPEAQLPLAQAAIYIACAPKSNACTLAIGAAVEDVKTQRTVPVPKHLKDSHYRGAEKLGHGAGYKYAHDFAGGHVEQDYLGVDKTFYHPTDRGYEAKIREHLKKLGRPDPPTDRGPAT
jgi:putative ATPase